MIVLGIETSCDDTSVALIKGQKGKWEEAPQILAHQSFSQEILLRKWGGVVPEIAARNHIQKLMPLLEDTFEKAKLKPQDIDLIGVTTHPGLLGPLLTGLNSAKTLSLIHRCPIVPVNHLYAHLEAIHLTETIAYPYVGLLVSGGHGLYFLVSSPSDMKMLGTTIDDAPGEAFDKGGKLMGLGYPAGRIIDDLAKEGNPKAFSFPIGLRDSKNASLSFSGVKTSLRQFLTEHPHLVAKENQTSFSQEFKDLCASYQYAIVEALKLKTRYALLAAKKLGHQNIPLVVGGGVACNSALRKTLGEAYNDVFFVKPSFCTDNGAMIANYALRTHQMAMPYPESLRLDARGRFISKKEKLERARGKS